MKAEDLFLELVAELLKNFINTAIKIAAKNSFTTYSCSKVNL